jgi:hypothetical protein
MTQDTELPRMRRADFYRLKEDELICALAQAIARFVDQHPSGTLTAHHDAVFAWARMSIDVPNGGFTQFFYNHHGDDGVAPLANLLDSLELPKASTILRDAAAIFRRHQSAFVVDNPWDGLFGSITEFEKRDFFDDGTVRKVVF